MRDLCKQFWIGVKG